MVDYEKIGERIREQRKHIRKVSQEQMAFDLNMYQADISNLEKAKSGSGIMDLGKLDCIAEYFDIPLETLLFGREGNTMPHYHGSEMKLKPVTRKPSQVHIQIMLKLTGLHDSSEIHPITYECGPYVLYSLIEKQVEIGLRTTIHNGKIENPYFSLPKLHTFIFSGAELLGLMVADITTVMQHVFQFDLGKLQEMIPTHVLDVTDVWRTLNPYWSLWLYSENESDEEKNKKKLIARCDEIRSTGENRNVLYIESVYVRDDSRRHGFFRMYVDLLKELYPESIMWLNMEPTDGNELERKYGFMPTYTVADLGQLSINAAIAEKVGFKVDPDSWHRRAETTDAYGSKTVETVLVRKCAYYLPAPIRELLKNDKDLVAEGRALQRIAQSTKESTTDEDEEKNDGIAIVHMNKGYIGGAFVLEVKMSGGPTGTYYATAFRKKDGFTDKLIVSESSLLNSARAPEDLTIEEYSFIEDAENSVYYEGLKAADTYVEFEIGTSKVFAKVSEYE